MRYTVTVHYRLLEMLMAAVLAGMPATAHAQSTSPASPPGSAAEVQPPSELPHHVTPWAATPAPESSAAAPAFAPSLPLSSKRWTNTGPAPLGPLNVSGRITEIAADPTQANVIYVAAAGGGV
jgi:hypothetical protein